MLPTCGHNVCGQCLKHITTRAKPGYLGSPTCRQQTFIREKDIDNLQTNLFLVKLMEQTKPQKQKEKLSIGIQACVAKLESLEELTKELNSCRDEKRERGEILRKEIKKMAAALVEWIHKNELELICKLDEFVSQQDEVFNGLLTKVENVQQKAQCQMELSLDALNWGNGDEISQLKSSIISLVHDGTEETLRKGVTELVSFTAKFDANKDLLRRIEHQGIGKLTMNDQCGIKVGLCTPLQFMRVSITSLRKITPSNFGFESFSPLSIATDGVNLVAVADPENNNILLLNKKGDFLKRFVTPVGSAQAPMMFSGVAFAKDKGDLIAVNGARDVHVLKPKDGTFKVSYKSSSQWGVKYCFVTLDPTGRLLLTCEPLGKQYRACIVVHSDTPLGKPDLRFGFAGDGALSFPFKALYHDRRYFVTDMEKGCVMVYCENGEFLWNFGRKDDDDGGNGHLVLPTGMAFNSRDETFLICDWGSSSIQSYTPDGIFLGAFPVDGRPTDIALFSDGTLVVSSKDDQWIQFFSISPLGAFKEKDDEQ